MGCFQNSGCRHVPSVVSLWQIVVHEASALNFSDVWGGGSQMPETGRAPRLQGSKLPCDFRSGLSRTAEAPIKGSSQTSTTSPRGQGKRSLVTASGSARRWLYWEATNAWLELQGFKDMKRSMISLFLTAAARVPLEVIARITAWSQEREVCRRLVMALLIVANECRAEALSHKVKNPQ